ncbi:hypothetical protein [Micromonospora sp. CA-244673]|uniref:hypothetical protein n=1 Tax=Micromonospora sp. CA-244673 TaxID=3239958 RepID=UPI003D8A81CA
MPLLALNDLDNYLFPLVPRLTKGTGRQFASVWATKRHAATSSVAVCQTQTVQDPGGLYSLQVHTTASASTNAYKRQIRDQITAAQPLPDGAIALQLAFVVGPRRAWPNLWKATIDSLGSILGVIPVPASGTHATAASQTLECTASSTPPWATTSPSEPAQLASKQPADETLSRIRPELGSVINGQATGRCHNATGTGITHGTARACRGSL